MFPLFFEILHFEKQPACPVAACLFSSLPKGWQSGRRLNQKAVSWAPSLIRVIGAHRWYNHDLIRWDWRDSRENHYL